MTVDTLERQGQKTSVLIFSYKAFASTPPQVLIDEMTQQVEEVNCGEDN